MVQIIMKIPRSESKKMDLEIMTLKHKGIRTSKAKICIGRLVNAVIPNVIQFAKTKELTVACNIEVPKAIYKVATMIANVKENKITIHDVLLYLILNTK